MSQNNYENDDLWGGSDIDDLDDLGGDLPDFPDSSLDTEDQFPLDDNLDDEEGGGPSRTFILLLAGLAVVFVVLVGVVAAIFFTQGEECGEACILATEITSQNQTIEANVASSQTSVAVLSTETQVAVETQNFQATQTADVQATQTLDTQNTAVAATFTQESIDATNTQVAVEDSIAATEGAAGTQTAEAAPTDTPVPVAAEALTVPVRGLNDRPLPSGLTVCIFRDNGDGQFNPSSAVNDADCSPNITSSTPVNLDGATGGDTITGGDTTTGSDTTGGAQPGLNPIFQTATAVAGGGATGSDTTTGGDTTGGESAPPTANPLNPIFQTATAQAAGNSGGGAQPPTPTAEGESRNGQMMARSFPQPDTLGNPQQQGEEDEFVDSIIIDAQGNITIPSLEPGEYWFTIGSQDFNINVKGTEQEVFTFPTADGEGITITVNVDPDTINIGGQPAVTPGGCTLSPIFCTATAIAEGALAGSGTPAPEEITPTALPDGGFFDGDSDSVSSIDLLVLGAIGMVLVGVVLAARRMRATI